MDATADPVALRVRVTGRGVAAGVLGPAALAGGLAWSYPGLVALGTGMVVLLVVALVTVLVPAPLEPRRRVTPLRVPRTSPCTATLRVTSRARRGAMALDAEEPIGGRRVPVAVPRLRAGHTVEATYAVPTDRRGVVEVGPLRLRRVGVAGLAVAEGTVGGVLPVHVLPRVLPVLGLPAGVRRGHVGADERVERGGTDLRALREYVPGDDLRRVHWATSARSGTLMVREDADPSRPHVTLLVDDRAASWTGEQFEDAVEVAASLATTVVGTGHPLRLLGTSGGLDVDVPAAAPGTLAPGAEEVLAQLSGLATVDAPGLPPVLRDADVVVVVTGAAAPVDELVADAARAAVGVVLVLDAATTAPASHGPVVVLRGPRAEDLLAAWDAAVA